MGPSCAGVSFLPPPDFPVRISNCLLKNVHLSVHSHPLFARNNYMYSIIFKPPRTHVRVCDVNHAYKYVYEAPLPQFRAEHRLTIKQACWFWAFSRFWSYYCKRAFARQNWSPSWVTALPESRSATAMVCFLGFKTEVLALKHESRIIIYCWDVFKVSTVFLSGLWVSPLLLFSAQILAWKWETRSVKFICFQSISDNPTLVP